MFINFYQPAKCDYIYTNNKSVSNKLFLKSSPKILNNKRLLNFSNLYEKNNLEKIFHTNFFGKNKFTLLAAIREDKQELIIKSDKQSQINDVIFAEGNVTVSYMGKLLKADNLIYDKTNKKISAEGNIVLILGDQILKITKLEYSFITKKGFLLDVQGSINTSTFFSDLSSNFSLLDSNKIESILELTKKEVLNTPGKVERWLFFTDKISIDGEKWESKRAVFSNDLLELEQLKLEINSLKVISKGDKLRFNSSLNYLIFEEKVSIPFWYGDRTLTKSGEGEFLNLENRWNIGYENLDKDGYFIGRKFDPIDISDNFVLDLEPQFLIQRSINGYTKSFVKKNESITSEKVKRNASYKDYFALKSQIKGRINYWDLQIEKNLNSFDFDKFSDAFRLKTNLSKKINFLDTTWDKSFYGVYRDRVWNGSLGEAEIYTGFGSKLSKENTWIVKGIKKTEYLSLGLAKIKAEALHSKSLVTNNKGNLFYSIDQKFPIKIQDPKNKAIDNSYMYIPRPITKGLYLNSRLEASYSFYENGNQSKYLGLGLGPEIILGNFKNKMFDYTRFSIIPFYKFSNGDSVFKFDQNYEKFTLNIALDQQLFGPFILKSTGTLNLTSNSDDYAKFIDSKISLNWKKRSYEFGIFYQPHNQIGGISFNIFGFK